MKDNNIIGPFSLNDWTTLVDIRSSNEYLSTYGTGFNPVIEKNQKVYKEYLKRYI